MQKRTIFISLVAVALSFLTGCASITAGKNQPVSIETHCSGVSIEGAHCRLVNDKGEWFISQTPGSVVIQKAWGDLAVKCTKEGKGEAIGSFRSASNMGVWGNIILGGLIGFAVDAGSGAGFDYPPKMNVDLCVVPPAAAPAKAVDPAATPAQPATPAAAAAAPPPAK